MDRLPLPLVQSPHYARAAALLRLTVRRHRLDGDDGDGAQWLIHSRRLPCLGPVDLLSRGPVCRDPARALACLNALPARQGLRPLILNADPLFGVAMLRDAGFWPLMTPATLAMLPLGRDAKMRAALRQKWRNRLNRAESHGLSIDWREFPKDGRHWLLQADAAQQSRRGYRGWPAVLTRAFAAANPGQARVLTIGHRGQAVAAGLFLCHGPVATYHIGHSLPEGRDLNAMNLLLWEAMRHLSARGHRMLDLGTLDTETAAGLAHFKLGTGAQAIRQGGTWLYQRGLAPLARRLPVCLASQRSSIQRPSGQKA